MKTIYFEADDDMQNIIEEIKHKIIVGKYKIKSLNQFIESAILVFEKLLDNNISAFEFDFFIDYCKVKKENKNFQA